MICFISDLHLCDEKPELTALFDYFVHNIAPKYSHLYILGDFFEAWVGDDFDSKTTSIVKKGLLGYTQQGGKLSIMHGNRDFLIGQSFCNVVNARLLEDIHDLEFNFTEAGNSNKLDVVTQSANRKVIRLMHGDQLCTDDLKYQSFRSMVRSQAWQKDFLSKPLAERMAIAEYMRSQSQTNEHASNKDKDPENIMDVNQEAVTLHWQQNPLLLHGHTHRPAKHEFKHFKRFVLSDWRDYGNFAELSDDGSITSWNFWLDGNISKIFSSEALF
jgi:UDP-2,3-diacylglucosamine hydrolase